MSLLLNFVIEIEETTENLMRQQQISLITKTQKKTLQTETSIWDPNHRKAIKRAPTRATGRREAGAAMRLPMPYFPLSISQEIMSRWKYSRWCAPCWCEVVSCSHYVPQQGLNYVANLVKSCP